MFIAMIQAAIFTVLSPTWGLTDFEYNGRSYDLLEANTFFGPKYVSVAGALIDSSNNSALPVYGSCYPEPGNTYFCSMETEGLYIRMRAELSGGGVIQFADLDGRTLHTAEINLLTSIPGISRIEGPTL